MERASGHRIGERAGRVLLRPGPAHHSERLVGELGRDPRSACARDQGALAQSCRRRGGNAELEAFLGGVGEQVVGLVDSPASQCDIASPMSALVRNWLPRARVASASSASARILTIPR